MAVAPRIYNRSRAKPGAGASPPEIVALGFTIVQIAASEVTRGGIAPWTDRSLEVMTEIWPDYSGPLAQPLQRMEQQMRALLEKGVTGITCRRAHEISAASWRTLLQGLKTTHPAAWFCAEALGRHVNDLWALESAGFDFLCSSVGWWNGSDAWYFEQQGLYPRVGSSLGFPLIAPGMSGTERLQRYRWVSLLSAGVLLDAGDEVGITAGIAELNRFKASRRELNTDGSWQRFTESDAPVTGLIRTGRGDRLLVAVNRTDAAALLNLDSALAALSPHVADLQEIGASASHTPLWPQLELAPRALRVFVAVRQLKRREVGPVVAAPDRPPSRVLIERIAPELDGGEFPIKRIAGDVLNVSADIFRDGHDKLAAALLVQQFGETDWSIIPFTPGDNDRWSGQVLLTTVGDARFVIEAWTDHFASWADEVTKKRAAGQPLHLELVEGRTLVAAAAERAHGALQGCLQACVRRLNEPPAGDASQLDLLLSKLVALWMAQAPDRSDAAISPTRTVTVDRSAARFSAWYEMFPRSQGNDPAKSSTFVDCVRRFPAIRELGFDVIYFVPIHPIGEVNRKGRNNHPTAQPGEPGSPYAIGSSAGGHTAIAPDLGTMEDFRTLIAAARASGMEVALDFAVQCAPDHPWLKEHPDWFKRRADGSIKYAENPPKKYQDIVNVDFDGPDWHSLWEALRDAVQFWIDEGVKIFRVDNPHTKPVAFWQWLIESIHRHYPDVLFLAEAFTRPKMMRRLAKAGFSQSYTYFTWRTTKAELTDYLTELTRSESVEYFRPNFFPTTPDILPHELQTGGRASFRARFVLAATLSGSYGIYNGYELCEAGGLPGKEEYQDSEKYQFKVRDWNRPGHIKDDIRRLNELRRNTRSLQLFDNLEFLPSSHPDVLFYAKGLPGGAERILIAVSLNFHEPVETELTFPFAAWGLPPGAHFVTEELFSDYRQEWVGEKHLVTLDPRAQPALVWKLL